MAPVKKDNNALNEASTYLIDTVWDGYVNGMKTVFASQKEVEKLILNSLSEQKSNFKSAEESFIKAEQELHKMAEEMRHAIEENIAKTNGEQVGKMVADWNKRLYEIAAQIQILSLTPNKATTDFAEKLQAQWQEIINQYSTQQEKTRNELESLATNFYSHVKETQKGLANAVQANTEYAMSYLKNK